MDIFLVTIGLVIFFLICLFRLDIGLAILAMLLPTYVVRFKVGFLPMTFLEGMILAIFLVWLVQNTKEKSLISNLKSQISKLKKLKLLVPIILFLVAATISVFVSPNLRSAAGIWKAYFIEPLLLFLVFISTIKTEKQMKLILYGLGISAIWVSVIGVYQKFTGWAIPNPLWQAEATRRVTSIYGYPNALGLYLGPIIVFYLALIKIKNSRLHRGFSTKSEQKSKIKNINQKIKNIADIVFKIIVIIFALLAIVFAKSHGAWMGVLTGILFLGLLSKKRAWFVLALIVLVLLFLFPQTRNRILDLAGYEENIGLRLDMWKDSLRLIKRFPVLGTGLAGFQPMYEKYREVRHFGLFLYPHQIILNFWLEIGLLGLVAFVWLLVRFFKMGFVILRKKLTAYSLQLTAGLMSALVCFIVHGLVDVPYFKNDLSVQFWIFFGLLVVIFTSFFRKAKTGSYK